MEVQRWRCGGKEREAWRMDVDDVWRDGEGGVDGGRRRWGGREREV